MVAEYWSMSSVQERSKAGFPEGSAAVWVAPVEADPMLTSSIRDAKIMRGNENAIVWNVRERRPVAALIGTGTAIVWIESVEDLAIANEEVGADRATVSVDVVAIDCPILISRKSNEMNVHAIGETAIVIAIVIVTARDGGHEATIAIVTEIVSERNAIVIVIAGIEKIVEIVKMRTRRRSELKRNLRMIIRTTRMCRPAHILPSSSSTIMIRRWRRNTGFRRVGLSHRLRTTIMIPYKIIDLGGICSRRILFFHSAR